ncbi:SRPBCC domain-containing protein [Streptomyces kanasensis]|uniref:SRPBCC domain-containing protein n=1 Tax=Streptomyces kanasensis TaxID=936756 RepID=UPI0036FEE575
MEHEVFVPVAEPPLRDLLADPARVARCVPGLQQDADGAAGPLSGRLRVRVGGHTITYRGELHLTAREDGAYAVEGEGSEVRGGGAVKVALTARLTPAEDGTTLAFTGSAGAEGRLAELPDDAVTAAAQRLLDRFGEALARGAAAPAAPAAAAGPQDGVTGPDGAGDADGPGDVDHDGVDDGAVEPTAADAAPGAAGDTAADAAHTDAGDDAADDEAGRRPTVFDTPVPPPSLDPDALDPFAVDGFPLDETVPGEPAVEAAHARRTMIGRSAEEVDHSPPRGRYAPVPGPDHRVGSAALRWLAPAAALAIASAVVVGRALRRRG